MKSMTLTNTKNVSRYLMLFIAILCQSMAYILIKLGSDHIVGFNLLLLLSNYYYIGSLFCLFIQALSWQQVLKHFDLFWAYLWMTLIYPVLLLSSVFIFNEKITITTIIGVMCIIAGVIIINRDKK